MAERPPDRADAVSGPITTVTHVARELLMYNVTEEELSALNSELPNVSIGFLFFAAGCSVAFGTTAWGPDIKAESAGDFRALFWVSVFGFVFCSIWSLYATVHRRRVVRRVRKRPAPTDQTRVVNQ